MIKEKNIFLKIIKWIFVILFFPLSLLFVAYFNRKHNTYNYEWEEKEANEKLES
ncbi:MAG: preprotein translocase subunit SecG [Crocinitomix sp.]